ncbi:MAG: TMEM165/GDT1 family protein [Candidatus Omnitrophota bacterium]|nr:MAG: TMEM165/GDT1 family protein [Candidatus Omnitrophota bacterium]
MDWKIFLATFGTIFLAELGDKTQVANLCLAAKSKSWFSVFLASVAAFSIVTLVTVSLGGLLCKFIRPDHIRYGAASLFVIIGLLMFFGKI